MSVNRLFVVENQFDVAVDFCVRGRFFALALKFGEEEGLVACEFEHDQVSSGGSFS